LIDEVEFLMDDANADGLGFARAGEADGFSLEEQLSLVVGDDTGEDFHEGAFAGAVFADDGVEFSPTDVERNIRECEDSGIELRDVLDGEDVFRHGE